MNRVLVVYRDSDAAGYANRLKPRLIAKYGPSRVVDPTVVPHPGDAVIALIGRAWLRYPAKDGTRALDDPNDPVRLSIEEALHLGLTLVPVYLDNTPRPPADMLPIALRPILKCRFQEMSFANFHQDADEILALLV